MSIQVNTPTHNFTPAASPFARVAPQHLAGNIKQWRIFWRSRQTIPFSGGCLYHSKQNYDRKQNMGGNSRERPSRHCRNKWSQTLPQLWSLPTYLRPQCHIFADIACPNHPACCICKMYLCLKIGDLRAPHRHGENHGRKVVHFSE